MQMMIKVKGLEMVQMEVLLIQRMLQMLISVTVERGMRMVVLMLRVLMVTRERMV